MAISDKTFSAAGGAVNDLFGGIGALLQGSMKAQGLRIQSQADLLQASGNLTEAENYDLASRLAKQNEQFTQTSTAIQEMQALRNTTMQIGGQRAAIAGAGFAMSGSGLDILADSARQGALTQAVVNQQGLVTEAGYEEQAQSYTNMAGAARQAAAGEESIANQTEELANETQNASTIASIGDFAGAALNAAAAIATL